MTVFKLSKEVQDTNDTHIKSKTKTLEMREESLNENNSSKHHRLTPSSPSDDALLNISLLSKKIFTMHIWTSEKVLFSLKHFVLFAWEWFIFDLSFYVQERTKFYVETNIVLLIAYICKGRLLMIKYRV